MNTARHRATLADVARRAGVSPVTVSRAIRQPEMVSEALRERINDAVASLNYIPNHLASALASTRTRIVGVVVPSLTNGVFEDYLNAIQDVLNPAGIQMLVLNVRYSKAEEEKAIETLLGYHPEAMMVVGVDQTERSRQMLKNSGIPVVQTMDLTSDPIDLNIGFDHEAAGVEAVRYLLAQGHKRIAHLTVRTDPRAARRALGYNAAMKEAGLSTKDLIAMSPQHSAIDVGAELFSEILARAPDVTAVFTCNDDLALGTMFECQRRGISVPDDVAIIGFNDLDYCQAAVPQLSTVSTKRQEIGTLAGRSVLNIIRGTGTRPEERTVDVGFSIQPRGSTTLKPARARRRPPPINDRDRESA